MNRTIILGAVLALFSGAAAAQSGGTSQTQDEKNMTAGAVSSGTKTAYQEKLQQAYSDFNAEHYDKATSELRDVIKKEPNNLTAHKMLAAVYQKQNNVVGMVPELEAVARLDPKDANTQSNLGVAYLQTGSFDKAVLVFRAAQARSPKDATVAYDLGLALLQTGKSDEAAVAFQKAIKIKPSAVAYEQLGTALEKSGKDAEAAAAFDAATNLDPKDAQAALYTGMTYHQAGHDDKAVPALQRALALGTADKFSAHMVLAEVYGHAGKTDEAIAEYKAASQIKPDDFGAAANLGVLSQNAGKKADALAAYRRALTLKAPTPEAMAQLQDTLAGLLAQDGGTDEAVTLLVQATQGDPRNAQYLGELGQVYEKQGKMDLAAAAYRKAVALDAHQPESVAGLARLKLKK